MTITEGTTAPHNDTDITVTAPSGKSLSFHAENWWLPQTVTLSAAEESAGGRTDDSITGTRTITHTASGGGYTGVTANLAATEADDDTAKAAILLRNAGDSANVTTLAVPEDDSNGASYSVKLSHKPGANVTVSITGASGQDDNITANPGSLTFTPANYDTAQTVKLTAADDPDQMQGARVFTHTASATDVTATLTATEIENDKATVVSPMSLTVKEGGSATYTVRLSVVPTHSVSVGVQVASGQDTDISVNKSSLSFSTTNWDREQTVTVRARSDADTAAGTTNIRHVGTSTDPDYNGTSTLVQLPVTESEPPLLVRDAADSSDITTLGVPENGSATYKVKLSAEPSSSVTVSMRLQSDGDSDITVKPSSLTFTTQNWNITKTVTVSAADDGDKIAGSRTITHRVSGDGYSNAASIVLTATEEENDEAIVINPATGISVNEGGTATYTVKLSNAPTATVTVTIAESITAPDNDADITVTSTDYSNAQTVTVSAGQDVDLLNGTRAINHTASGAGSGYAGVTASLIATEADDDNDGEIVISDSNTGDALALGDVPEGSTATYHVKLSKQPRANVTVTIAEDSGGDPDITVTTPSNKTLTFTTSNWNQTQDVTLTAVEDAGAAMDGTRVINHTASATGGYTTSITASLTAKELDNDKTVILMDSSGANDISSIIVDEGSSVTYRVKLGHRPEGNVTVALTESTNDPNADISFTPATLTFTTGNWNNLKTVTVTAANDSNTTNGLITVITHTATGGRFNSITATLTVKENDNDNNVSPTSDSAPAAVASVSATHNGDTVTASWPAPADATKYHVTYSTDDGGSWTLAANPHTGTGITIGSADADQEYIVGVRAGNDGGWSAWVNSPPAKHDEGASTQ